MTENQSKSAFLWEKIKAIRNVAFPVWIKVVGWIYILLGVLIFYSSISFLFVGREVALAVGYWKPILFGLVVGSGVSLLGYKIIKRVNVPWRFIGIIIAVFCLWAPPVGTIFGIFSLYILIRGRDYFK